MVAALHEPLLGALRDGATPIATAGLELLAALGQLASPPPEASCPAGRAAARQCACAQQQAGQPAGVRAAEGGPLCGGALAALGQEALPIALRLGTAPSPALHAPARAACLALLRACPPAGLLPLLLAGCAGAEAGADATGAGAGAGSARRDGGEARRPAPSMRRLCLELLAALLLGAPAQPAAGAAAAGEQAQLAAQQADRDRLLYHLQRGAAAPLEAFFQRALLDGGSFRGGGANSGAAACDSAEGRATCDAFVGFAQLWPAPAANISRATAPPVRQAIADAFARCGASGGQAGGAGAGGGAAGGGGGGSGGGSFSRGSGGGGTAAKAASQAAAVAAATTACVGGGGSSLEHIHASADVVSA